jgi:hypothetical protein
MDDFIFCKLFLKLNLIKAYAPSGDRGLESLFEVKLSALTFSHSS